MCSTILQKLPRSTEIQFHIAQFTHDHTFHWFSFLLRLTTPPSHSAFWHLMPKKLLVFKPLSQVQFLAEIIYVNHLRLP